MQRAYRLIHVAAERCSVGRVEVGTVARKPLMEGGRKVGLLQMIPRVASRKAVSLGRRGGSDGGKNKGTLIGA